jgi:hypothetical protein
MDSKSSDILICLTLETTHDSAKYPADYRRIYADDSLGKMGEGGPEKASALANIDDEAKNTEFPSIIQMDW